MEEKKMMNSEELVNEVQNEGLNIVCDEEAGAMSVIDPGDSNGGIGCC